MKKNNTRTKPKKKSAATAEAVKARTHINTKHITDTAMNRVKERCVYTMHTSYTEHGSKQLVWPKKNELPSYSGGKVMRSKEGTQYLLWIQYTHTPTNFTKTCNPSTFVYCNPPHI